MIDIALTTEFAITAGGVRWPGPIGSSGGLPRGQAAGTAAVASCEDAYALVRAHGERIQHGSSRHGGADDREPVDEL